MSQLSATTFKKTTSFEPDLFDSLLKWHLYSDNDRNDLSQFLSPSTKTIDSNLLTKLTKTDRHLVQSYVDAQGGVAEDLKDAVLRQVSFVDKMWDKLWIRSPGLDGTIRRALGRYEQFLRLFKIYPSQMFVPTLDIDLAWHTHQCSPSKYYKATQELAGKFVNHDDSIVQEKLDTSLQDTKSLYRMRFGREYHICGCWDCEALQSALEKAEKGVKWDGIAKQVGETVAYYRAVEVARRKKKPISTQ